MSPLNTYENSDAPSIESEIIVAAVSIDVAPVATQIKAPEIDGIVAISQAHSCLMRHPVAS